MYWEKEIRVRLTTRRIMGGILTTMSVVNLIVVGTMVGTTPSTSTPTLTALETLTAQFQDATSTVPVSATSEVITSASTSTPSATLTSTNLPTLVMCVLRSYWPTYYVEQYDTLLSLARNTGSTPEELMLANCLHDDHISIGQVLYVPRIPIRTLTPTLHATSTDTPSNTPDFTPTTVTSEITLTEPPSDTPTIFQNSKANVLCRNELPYINFSVTPIDPQGITSVITYYSASNGKWIEAPMSPVEGTSFSSGNISTDYPTGTTVSYYFTAFDNLKNSTDSSQYEYKVSLPNCSYIEVGF